VDESPNPGGDQDTEDRIDAITAAGGYVRFFNLPRNVSKNKFSAVTVSGTGVIARCPDYEAIAVRKNVLSAEAFVPLVSTRGGASFTDSGAYYTSFTVSIDALNQITVDSSRALLFTYTEGVTEIDVTALPPPVENPPAAPHALTLTGLPDTAAPANFLDVLVYNSEGVVAKCPDYTKITVSSFNGTRAAVIPLVYDNNKAFNGQDFSDSGSFIVTFSLFADALHGIVVLPENNCLIPFDNGSAVADLSGVPSVPRNYLTITNLPPNLQELNVKDVSVFDQSGKIGLCQDYGALVILPNGPTSTLKIPLRYSAVDRPFGETGSYYIAFDLNVDALTRIRISEADRVIAGFLSGNAVLDASLLPQGAPLPFLTVLGLPKNTAKNNFSDVFLYNAAGKIAKCTDYLEITITKNGDFASAMIPLVYNDNAKEYFRDSGTFIVTFTVNVDVVTQIIKSFSDSLTAEFSDGSGIVDLSSDYGYFSGGLSNPLDASPPVIKKGTVFEINGGYVQLQKDTPVKPAAFQNTSLVYIYALQKPGGVEFEYSDEAPVYVPAKKAYYSGVRRALFKLVYLRDAVDQYVAKTYIGDGWTQFDHYPVTLPDLATISLPSAYSLSGSGNPAARTLTLRPGGYIFVLSGAGGGGGGGINGEGSRDRYGGTGGAGGFVSELTLLSQETSFSVFTGQGGNGSGYISYGYYQGAGAGGGGSGTFLFSPEGYFLCAGGGGGGGGGSANDGGGGGGGAGGSIGAGGGGGNGGGDYESWSDYYDYYPGSPGGSGGGAAGYYLSIGTGWGYAGGGAGSDDYGENGGGGGSACYSVYGVPDTWKNTNDANGSGGGGNHGGNGGGGGAGGNNRNAQRGGRASGGRGGWPHDGGGSAGSPGAAGSITVYKVF
jgi:hypothetical protein